MEENKEQALSQITTSLEQVPGYLSVKEAAKYMGVSARSIYGYLEKKKLAGGRIDRFVVVQEEDMHRFERKAPGRARVAIPDWHKPSYKNSLHVTTITVRVHPGQGALLNSQMAEIRRVGKHLFPGTAARYIVQNQQNAEEIDIVLIWRSTLLPSNEVREAAFAAFRLELADVFVWETATQKEGQVLLYA